jgi:MATE family multidrug resistance protein
LTPSLAQQARRTFALALPIILAQLASVAIGVVTTLMIGRLGGDALAAGGLGYSLFVSFQVIAQGLLSSVGVTVAHAIGAGRPEQGGAYVEGGLRLSVLATLPTVALVWAAPYGFVLLDVQPGIIAAATPFLHVLSLAVLPALWLNTLRYFLMAIGRPGVATLIAIAGVGLTVGFNELLMFGRFGVPALGLVGAAWSTVLGNLAMLGFTALYIECRPASRIFRIWRPRHRLPGAFRELIALSWPAAVAISFESLFFSLIATLAARFAPAELAAHMIAINCCYITFMLAVGLSQATLVRIAAAAGEGDAIAVRRIGLAGIALGLIGMGTGALVLLLAPRLIVSWFVDLGDPVNLPVLAASLPLLAIAALFQLFDGTQAIASGALRGLRDTRGPMVIAALAYWPGGLGLASLLAFGLHLRVVGLWWGMALGLATAAVLMSWRLFRRMAAVTPG